MEILSISQIQSDLAGIEASAASIGGGAGGAGAALAPAFDSTAVHGESGGAMVSFAQTLGDVVRQVDEKEQAASRRAEAVDSGRSDDLVGAMLASQEASLSFSMLMQVRNKLMGAFDEIIKLQL